MTEKVLLAIALTRNLEIIPDGLKLETTIVGEFCSWVAREPKDSQIYSRNENSPLSMLLLSKISSSKVW